MARGRLGWVTLGLGLAVAAGAAWVWNAEPQRLTSLLEGLKGPERPLASPVAAPDRRRQGAPIAVEIADARSARTTRDIETIGSLQADEFVRLAPEVPGRIVEIAFKEGRPIKAGDILIKLDDALAQAEVADAKARLALAKANNDRARALLKTGNVTEKGRDEALSSFGTAEAALDLAQTRLSKLTVRAPFDGLAGLRGVSIGAYVNAGTEVVSLAKIDTLKADFKVPESYLEEIKTGQKIEIRVDAYPERVFEGEIYAISPEVDVNGRALQVRARLDNKDMALRPGLFVRITVKGMTAREVVLVPEAAILPRRGDAFVFVTENGKAVEKQVRLGQRAKGEVEILEGLSLPARVVVAGQQKLRNGSAIDVVTEAPAGGRPGTAGVPQAPAGSKS